jgi:hypothetical protein
MDNTNSSADSTPTTVTELDGGKAVDLDLSSAAEIQTTPEELPDELLELDDDGDDDSEESTGLLAGAFGFTALALGFLSLSGSWLSSVYNSRASAHSQIFAKTATTQTQENQIGLNALTSGWHAQAAIGGIFALAALLVGVGVLASPSLLLSGKAPAWARAAGIAGIVLGVIGLLLAILTWYGVLAGGISAPPAAAS